MIMAIRTILYGYDVENGKTVINIQESEIVKKVYSSYHPNCLIRQEP